MVELKPFAVNANKHYKTGRREKRAVKVKNTVRLKVSKAVHVPLKNVKLSSSVNEFIWSRGREKPPHKLQLLLHSVSDIVTVYLASERDKIVKELEASSKKGKPKTDNASEKGKSKEKLSSKTESAASEASVTAEELERQKEKKELEKAARTLELARG